MLLALTALLPLAGCDSNERQDLQRERGQLVDQRRQLEQAAQQMAASKTPLSEQDRAQLTALQIDARRVTARIEAIDQRLLQLNMED
jgi:hypothetical protein